MKKILLFLLSSIILTLIVSFAPVMADFDYWDYNTRITVEEFPDYEHCFHPGNIKSYTCSTTSDEVVGFRMFYCEEIGEEEIVLSFSESGVFNAFKEQYPDIWEAFLDRNPCTDNVTQFELEEIYPTVDELSDYEELYYIENISSSTCSPDGGVRKISFGHYFGYTPSEYRIILDNIEILEAFREQYPDVWDDYIDYRNSFGSCLNDIDYDYFNPEEEINTSGESVWTSITSDTLSDYEEYFNVEEVVDASCATNYELFEICFNDNPNNENSLACIDSYETGETLRTEYPDFWFDIMYEINPCRLEEDEIEDFTLEPIEEENSCDEECEIYLENEAIETSEEREEENLNNNYIDIYHPEDLGTYHEYFTEEYFDEFLLNIENEISGLYFSYSTSSTKTTINIREDALEKFGQYYPDTWNYIMDQYNSAIEAQEATRDYYGDLIRCLNVIDYEENEDGEVIEATLFCNADKTVVVDDKKLIADYINDYEWEWDYKNKDFYNLGEEEEYLQNKIDIIEDGSLFFYEENENGYIDYFAIVDETKLNNFENRRNSFAEGIYWMDANSPNEELLILGQYIQENPDEWNKKMEWFNGEERKNTIWDNFSKLDDRLEDKWLEESPKEELYERGLVPFIDVIYRSWYHGFIESFKDYGFVEGYEDEQGNITGYFKPDAEVTYAEFIKMALNCTRLGEKIEGSESPYWDNEEVNALSADGYEYHWALQFYKIAKYLDTRLVSEPNFDLDQPITRKEVVGFINDIVGDRFEPEDEMNITTECFTDLDSQDKYSEEICFFKHRNLIDGHPDGSFRPDTYINRAETVKTLAIIEDIISRQNYEENGEEENYGDEEGIYGDEEGLICEGCEAITKAEFFKKVIEATEIPIDTDGNPTFEDIPEDHPYYDYVATAYNLGYIHGEVGLYDTINRAEATKILVNLFGVADNGEDYGPVGDVLGGEWFEKYMKIFYQHGIYEGEFFYPANALTVEVLDEWIEKLLVL